MAGPDDLIESVLERFTGRGWVKPDGIHLPQHLSESGASFIEIVIRCHVA
jgi:hypothetical protein